MANLQNLIFIIFIFIYYFIYLLREFNISNLLEHSIFQIIILFYINKFWRIVIRKKIYIIELLNL